MKNSSLNKELAKISNEKNVEKLTQEWLEKAVRFINREDKANLSAGMYHR